MIKKLGLGIVAVCFCTIIVAQKTMTTDVLVVGGGASGTAAGIQAARLGVKVIIVEETTWLGGMITAAGVSAFDGNHNMPSGFFGEFREQLYKVYGGPKNVETGWVSNTLFEPHIGDSIFKAMVAKEKNITVLYNSFFFKTIKNGTTIKGIEYINAYGEKNKIIAKQTIDATELGDVIANAAIPTDIGMEAKTKTGEVAGVPIANNIVQDLTYVAILKNYGVDKSIPKPNNYDPLEFDGCCKDFCSTPEKLASNVTAQQLIDYGKLPNGKYMINWPGKGNDIYLHLINLTREQRLEELKKAKAKTIRFVYFLQHQLGFNTLSFANDEYTTTDKLPLIPYHRESRRLQGKVRLKMQHISNPFEQQLYRTGIAVGDYPIDHHHRENLNVPKELGFVPVPSYNIPMGCLLPQNNYKGIIVAEKSISVSNIVNGTTRLQPVVLLIGQAAGTIAALAVQQNKQAYELAIRDVQNSLLETKAYIMPYYDVKPTHPYWESIQRIGATGILKGTGEPYKWANRTWFYPDSAVTTKGLISVLQQFYKYKIWMKLDKEFLTIREGILLIKNNTDLKKKPTNIIDKQSWESFGLTNFNESRNITRGEFAVLLDKIINPFHINRKIDWQGNIR